MGKSTLEVETTRDGRVTILNLSGPVDSANFNTFKKALAQVGGAQRAYAVLDCTGLTYMNSKGFGLLSQYHRTMLAGMGEIAVCGLNRKLVKTMDLLGLGQMLKMFDTREEALAAMR
jgi:anti-sigma B factor antagonist